MTILKQSYISLLFIALLGTGISACSVPQPSNSIEIKRLIFINQTSEPLQDVKIRISKTGEFVHCGYILPNTECSMGFRLREYQGNRFDVFWLDNKQPRSVENVLVSVAEDVVPGKPVNAVILFAKDGQFSATLQH